MAIARTASVTVTGPTGGPYAATQNSAQFGQKVTTTVTANSTPPNFFTSSTPFVTPGGTLTVSAGGSNNFTSSDTRLGQTGVVAGDYSITSSTDPALPQATSSGSFEGYGGVVGLTYSGFGTWSLNPCLQGSGTDCTPVYVGVTAGASPDNVETVSMPTSGGANFLGGAAGYVIQPVANNANNAGGFFGTANLHANFVSGAVTGGINGILVYSPGGDTLVGTLNDIGFGATISGAAFSGTASVTGSAGTAFDISGATGLVSGGFYGPTANETSGVFSLSGGPNNTQVLGSFGAKRGNSGLVFTETALPVGTPGTNLTATIATALSGQVARVDSAFDSGPAGFIGHETYVTPGGVVVVQSGGTNNYNASNTKVGVSGVGNGDYTITSSSDPAVTTAGGGNFEGFAGVVGLQYSAFGTWNISPCDNSTDCTPAYVGTFGGANQISTLTATMPTSGTATYSGGATGFVVQPFATNPLNAGQFYGTSSLTANFGSGSGTITGSITGINVYSVDGGTTLVGSMNNIGLSGTISGSTITGTSSVTGSAGTAFDIAGATGSLHAGFYGPNAAEVAGVFNLSGGANNTTVAGSFGAIAAPPP